MIRFAAVCCLRVEDFLMISREWEVGISPRYDL